MARLPITGGFHDAQDNASVIGAVSTVAAATGSSALGGYFYSVTYTATGTVTFDLASSSCVAGQTFYIKDSGGNAGVNNITITTEGAETIDGAASFVINTNYQSVTLISNGSNWFVV